MPEPPVADKVWCWSGQKQSPQKSVGYAVVEAWNCVIDTGLSVITACTIQIYTTAVCVHKYKIHTII